LFEHNASGGLWSIMMAAYGPKAYKLKKMLISTLVVSVIAGLLCSGHSSQIGR